MDSLSLVGAAVTGTGACYLLWHGLKGADPFEAIIGFTFAIMCASFSYTGGLIGYVTRVIL